jgi:hypothetical protein
MAQRWSICQPVGLSRNRKRLAGGLSASDAQRLEKDLGAACDKLRALKILVPEALAAVRAHLADLRAQNAGEKKPAKRFDPRDGMPIPPGGF